MIFINPTHYRLSKNNKSMPKFHYDLKFKKKNFWFKNCSTFNNFLIISPKIMKPTQCTPTDQGLSDKNEMKGTMVLEISMWN